MRGPISAFENLDINTAIAVPMLTVDFDTVSKYWDDLRSSGRLWFRLCDVPQEPRLRDIYRLFHQHAPNMYVVRWGQQIAGEFMLTTFTGRAAQIHFSTHPELHIRQGVPLVRKIVKDLLHWKEKGNPDRYYLDTLYGLTPVMNRAACLYVLKVGFKKMFTMPSGINFKGHVTDAMVTLATRGIFDGR